MGGGATRSPPTGPGRTALIVGRVRLSRGGTPGSRPNLAHNVDRHSNKSPLEPPSPPELEQLAQQCRMIQPQPFPIEPARVPTKSLRRRFSPQQIEDLVAQYNAGAAIRALSLEYGVSRSGLRQLLQAEGVTLRVQGVTPEDVEKVVQLCGNGLTIRQVVEQIGYSYGTIRKMLHEQDVTLRSEGH